MKLSYDDLTKRFIAHCSFEERNIPKSKGFWWDNEIKSWITNSLATALKLKEYADDQCVRVFNRFLITEKSFEGAVVYSSDKTPFEYQKDAVKFALSRNRSLIAADPGLGKSAIAAMAAASSGKHVLFICPPFLKLNIEKEFREWCPKANSVTVLPDSMLDKEIAARLVSTKNKKDTILIVDECFSPDTLVNSESGLRKISELKIGDRVYNCAGLDEITFVHRKSVSEVLAVQTQFSDIFCTPNHLFFTARGWIEAKELNRNDEIIELEKAMQILSGENSKQTEARFLREILLSQSNVGAPRIQEKTLRENAGGCSTLALRENEIKQSDAQKENSRESQRDPSGDGTQTRSAWRQWLWPDKARTGFEKRAWKGLGFQLCNTNKKTPKREVSYLLQARFSFSRAQTWGRMRRFITQSFSKKSPRHKKGQVIGVSRVGDSTLQKLGYLDSNGKCYFYDLSVKNHPSYSVNGLLVHNCHRFKTLTAKRTRALFKNIVPKFEHVIFMSGTPMPNRPFELYPLLNFAAPEIIDFMDPHEFALKYCNAFRSDFGWDYSGATNVDDLFSKMREKFMLRIKKQDVLKELPPKIEELLILDKKEPPKLEVMSQRILKEYSSDNVSALLGSSAVSTYRRELGEYTAPFVAKAVKEILEGNEEALLLFAHHKSVIEILHRELLDFDPIIITGDTPPSSRQNLVDEFERRAKDNKRRIVIGNLIACGVGFNMTRATQVVFAESSWVPAENAQASDRAHRIGQRDSVYVRHCVIPNTLHALILSSQMRKQAIANKL